MHFLSPGYLILLIGVVALAALYVVLQLRRKRFVARFSNAELLGSVAPKRPGWRRHLTFALLLIAMTVLSIGVARPSGAVRVPQERATVMLNIDTSLSMKATDVLPSRLQAAQGAAKTFVDLLPARINLGLVNFAKSASVLVSPTTNREVVKRGIASLTLSNYTAIGEAIYTSLDSIKVFSAAAAGKHEKPAPARIVLLSDGGNTWGRPLSSAIEAARAAHVEVSTIAFGTPTGTVSQDGRLVSVPADDAALRDIAVKTGGSFHTAASEAELRSVYKDIGSQIGYTTEHKDISWRFFLVGVLALFAAGGAAMLWSGRLV